MVRIVNFNERESEDGSTFFALELQGGMELVKSQSSSNYYATARKTSITSTFDETTCKSLIGTEIPGRIERQECDLYEYTIKETGEVIELSHRYEYVPEESMEERPITGSEKLKEEKPVSNFDFNDFSIPEVTTPVEDVAEAELV